MKSICQISNVLLGSLKCPGPLQTGFSGLYFGQVGQVRQVILVALLMFSH